MKNPQYVLHDLPGDSNWLERPHWPQMRRRVARTRRPAPGKTDVEWLQTVSCTISSGRNCMSQSKKCGEEKQRGRASTALVYTALILFTVTVADSAPAFLSAVPSEWALL